MNARSAIGLIESIYGVKLTTRRQTASVSVGTGATQILTHNPARIYAEVSFSQMGQVTLARAIGEIPNSPDVLYPNVHFVTDYQTDGDEVVEALYGQSSTVAISVQVTEYILSGLAPDQVVVNA